MQDAHGPHSDDNVAIVWKNLTTWIHDHGGYVHPDLELRAIVSSSSSSSMDKKKGNNNDNSVSRHRGVFAKKAISVNELLIRLPFHLAIHGKDAARFPTTYTTIFKIQQEQPMAATRSSSSSDKKDNHDDASAPVLVESSSDSRRATSPWLRCLAAYYYYQHYNSSEESSNSKSIMSWSPYFASLPRQYETVSAWSRDEIDNYLSGTYCSGTDHGLLSWHTGSDEALLRERYFQKIRPYLIHCQVLLLPCSPNVDTAKKHTDTEEIEEFRRFTIAAQCMSTRCFHLSKEQQRQRGGATTAASVNKPAAVAETPTHQTAEKGDTNNIMEEEDASYTGPFLLPAIDLLNHASCHDGDGEASFVTTLVYDSSSSSSRNCFTMTAERCIAAGQEILHSYGNDLNASQFLQTFGFVPLATMERCIEMMTKKTTTWTAAAAAAAAASSAPITTSINIDKHGPSITPAFLSKDSILEACWSVIEDDDYPNQLARTMQEKGMDDEDETWTVQLDKTRNTDFIPDRLLISHHHLDNSFEHNNNDKASNDNDASSILTTELVTLACIPFLPKCAYAEVAQSLLGREVLQDYFLGQLVCKSLLKAIRHKWASYLPIQFPFDNNHKNDKDGTNSSKQQQQNEKGRTNGGNGKEGDDDDDVILLRQLLYASRDDNKSSSMTSSLNASVSTTRLMYGLAVRLEEKLSLRALRKEIMMILASLDEQNDDDEEEEHDDNHEDHVDSKRQKL